MSIKELQKYTAVSKYSVWLKGHKRREAWGESVDRVKNMMLEVHPSLSEDIEKYYGMVKEQKVLGSQRALQFGGKPILKHNSRIFNCVGSYCDRAKFFQECFYLLLCGSGTGFSVQKHHVSLLPNLVSKPNWLWVMCLYVISFFGKWGKTFRVEDSIEGWSDALGVLMSSYFVTPIKQFEKYKGWNIKFDYRGIRAKGSPLGCGIGNAPGYEPLQKALEKIRTVLDRCLNDNQNKLRTIDAFDIVMHSADAVISGGVRRCIAEGSRVLVKGKSFKNIEDIRIGDLVSTSDGWQKVVNFFEQGEQPTILIKHQDGELECTPNHRVAVLTNHLGEFEWKIASDLQSGDRLAFFKNNDDLGVNKLPDFEYVKPVNSTTCKDITIPELDTGIAWLLGEIHGDGYVLSTESSGEVSIACEGTNPEKAIRIQSELMRFGTNVFIQEPREDDNCYKIKTKSKQLATYFHQWLKQPKTTIRIPCCIKNSTNLIKLAYIQGVLDADGSIGARGQQVVCTVYQKFAKDIQNLLYSIGIVSRFKELSRSKMSDHWQTKYGVYIVNNEDREIFNECELGYKKFKGSLCQHNSNSYPIEFLNKINEQDLPSGWSKKIAKNNKRIPYSTWNKVFGKSNIVPVEVKEVISSARSVKTYDIEVENNHNFICEGVLVHNSATIALFSPEDELMINAKTGNWYFTNPQRARANISALLHRKHTSKEVFENLFKATKEFGEPGFFFADYYDVVCNPCCEISWITRHFFKRGSPELAIELANYEGPITTKESCKDDMPEDEVGLSGWGFCNLSTINGKTVTSEEDFYERCEAAAFIGTLQASFTKFPYLGHVTELIARKEALLGVSINGMQHHPEILLNPEIQRNGARIVKLTNAKYAKSLNISPSARTTCIKPEGNSAALLGSTSGIHPDHSRRYFRIVQANRLEAPYQYFKSVNPQACEASVWSSNNTDDCIRFCLQSQEGTTLKENLSAINLLDNVVSTYNNWVVTGKNEDLCVRRELNHNVSNTVHVRDNEWEEVKEYIYKNRADLAGVSLLSATGDKDYNQAPFTAIYSIEEQRAKWGLEAILRAGQLYPDFFMCGFNSLWDACACSLGYFEPKDGRQVAWKILIEDYAEAFFSSNIKHATYALKDASNLDLWNRLVDGYSDVNYLDVVEEKSTINIQGELACAGGSCLI